MGSRSWDPPSRDFLDRLFGIIWSFPPVQRIRMDSIRSDLHLIRRMLVWALLVALA